MAAKYKILGQVSPTLLTEETIYEIITDISCIASSIVVCNRGPSQATFRVSISAGGAATSNKDYIYYDLLIAANDTFIATIGVTLSMGDVVRVYASSSNLSFSLYGSEIN